MATHKPCHGCLDGCDRESHVHCVSCVNEPWPCDAQRAQELAASLSEDWHRLSKEVERYSQRSRDEDTARIRLNHERVRMRDALLKIDQLLSDRLADECSCRSVHEVALDALNSA